MSNYSNLSQATLVALCVSKDAVISELIKHLEEIENEIRKVTFQSGGEDSGCEIEDESRL